MEMLIFSIFTVQAGGAVADFVDDTRRRCGVAVALEAPEGAPTIHYERPDVPVCSPAALQALVDASSASPCDWAVTRDGGTVRVRPGVLSSADGCRPAPSLLDRAVGAYGRDGLTPSEASYVLEQANIKLVQERMRIGLSTATPATTLREVIDSRQPSTEGWRYGSGRLSSGFLLHWVYLDSIPWDGVDPRFLDEFVLLSSRAHELPRPVFLAAMRELHATHGSAQPSHPHDPNRAFDDAERGRFVELINRRESMTPEEFKRNYMLIVLDSDARRGGSR